LKRHGGAQQNGARERLRMQQQPPDLTGKPVFIAQGELDMYVPPEQGRALEQTLKSAGAEVEVLRVAQGHPLENIELRPLSLWAASHLI
jgi:predicted esterase